MKLLLTYNLGFSPFNKKVRFFIGPFRDTPVCFQSSHNLDNNPPSLLFHPCPAEFQIQSEEHSSSVRSKYLARVFSETRTFVMRLDHREQEFLMFTYYNYERWHSFCAQGTWNRSWYSYLSSDQSTGIPGISHSDNRHCNRCRDSSTVIIMSVKRLQVDNLSSTTAAISPTVGNPSVKHKTAMRTCALSCCTINKQSPITDDRLFGHKQCLTAQRIAVYVGTDNFFTPLQKPSIEITVRTIKSVVYYLLQ